MAVAVVAGDAEEVDAVHEAVVLVARRSLVAAFRRPVVLTFSLVQPMLWMGLFGFLFERSVALSGDVEVDYLTFVAPGIATMTLLFGSSQSGISLVRDHQTGMLGRMIRSRTPAAAQLAGKLLGDGLRLTLQATIVLGMALLLGADLAFHIDRLPIALLSTFSLVLLLSSTSCLLATLARQPELMGAYVHVVNMPLLFTSSALLPRRNLPEWLLLVAANNPLTVAAESLRALFLGSTPPAVSSLLGQLAVAILVFAFACVSLDRAGRLPQS